jgi:hypothetical protein
MINLPGFWSIMIPQVRYNTNLSWFEKVLYSEITALTNVSGYCFANNSYFEFVFQVSKSTIQKSLRKLEMSNLIRIEIITNETKQVIERKIFALADTPGVKNDTTPGVKNDTTPGVKNSTYNNTRKSNNTSFNNKSNNQSFSQSFKNKRPDVNPDWLADYLKEIEKSN